MKLFMIMVGCRPKGRFTEQHDIFFGIGNSLKEVLPEINAFWPEAKGQFHIDAWREVTVVDNHSISIGNANEVIENETQLFFINLGGYKENEFEEFHYKIITTGTTLAEATKKAKATSFYKHFGFKGATSHIDDKFGIDVDDVNKVKDILNPIYKEKYAIVVTKAATVLEEDALHIGYLKIDKL